MENDYYLHNFHVKEGRGVNFSMDFYRYAFGIQCADDGSEVIGRPQRASRTSSVSQIAAAESQRVKNVRKRVAAQNEMLSIWWKRALHSNLHQRIWMKNSSALSDGAALASDVEGSLLPSRYERLYQPEKMALFDRFFARGWATPLRSSHSAQHSDTKINEPESASSGSLARVITAQNCMSCVIDTPPPNQKSIKRDGTATKKFLEAHGFDSSFESYSKLFVDPHDRMTRNMRSNPEFVGDVSSEMSRVVPDEYRRYCTPSSALYTSPLSDNKQANAEFRMNLRELSLHADDVEGIRKVSRH